MLRCSDNNEPQKIYPLHNAFYGEKDMEHNSSVTLIAINKCVKISTKSNSLFLPVINSKKNEFDGRLFYSLLFLPEHFNFRWDWKLFVHNK